MREAATARVGLDAAPLAGVSDLSFRLVTKVVGGPDRVFTEMINAAGLVRGDRRTGRLLDRDPRERPVVVQLFGADPEIMAGAAAMVQEGGADAVNLNLACPVRKVMNIGAGLALARDPDRVARIFESTRKAAGRIPLSAKLRAGWDSAAPNVVEIARLAEKCGLDEVIVHPRFRGGYDQKADWRLIAEVAGSVRIAVTGNGDVSSGEDAARMVRETGCSRVMVGRAAIGDPWIFRRMRAVLDRVPEPPEPTLAERGAILLWHMRLHLERGGPNALRSFRKHLAWYAKGFPGAAAFRRRAMAAIEADEVRDLIFEHFPGSDDPVLNRG